MNCTYSSWSIFFILFALKWLALTQPHLRVVPQDTNLFIRSNLVLPAAVLEVVRYVCADALALHHYTHCWTFCCARQPRPCHGEACACNTIIMLYFLTGKNRLNGKHWMQCRWCILLLFWTKRRTPFVITCILTIFFFFTTYSGRTQYYRVVIVILYNRW